MYTLLWIIMALSILHFIFTQHSKRYEERDALEKLTTWFAIISIVAVVLNTMWF